MKTVWVVNVFHWYFGEINGTTPHVFATKKAARDFVETKANFYKPIDEPGEPQEVEVKS